MQDVLCEILHTAHILTFIDHDEVGSLVLVECTFEFIRRALHILLPLRLKEWQALAGYHTRMLLRQVLHGGQALVILGAVKLTGHCDFNRL